MKVGDLVRFCPQAWGTPLEDRPLGIVVKELYTPSVYQHPPVIDVHFPDPTGICSLNPDDLELLSGARN